MFMSLKKIAKLFNKKYGLMVNSGSSALMLAMEVLNLPKGSSNYPGINFWNNSLIHNKE